MKQRIEEKLKIYFSTKHSLAGISLCLVLFSCNNSFTVLDRKYQPGYTFNFSNKIKEQSNQLKEQEQIAVESMTEGLVVKNDYIEGNSVASLNNSELFIKKYKVQDYIMPCDTPPQKNIDEPWSLYKPKETNEEGVHGGKPIEPYSIASFCVIGLFVIIGALVGQVGVWLFFLLFSVLFTLSLISLIRIKKHPNKYSKISKVWNWIFVSLGLLLMLILLIILSVSL